MSYTSQPFSTNLSSITPLAIKGTTNQSAPLTIWQNASGETLASISNEGNFSASNYTPLIHRYVIGETGKFQSLSSAMTWLSANMNADTELLLDSGAYNISDTISIDLPYRLLINGIYYEAVRLQAATGLTGKPMVNVVSDVCFDKLTFLGNTLASYGTLSTENCIDIVGNIYSEITLFDMDTFNSGIQVLGDTASVFVFNSYLQNCDSGIKMNSNGANGVDVEVCSFVNCNKGVSLQKGVSAIFHVMGNIFDNGVGGTCISYTPSAYSYSDSPAIINNVWNNMGSFYTGFNFSLSGGRDADIYLRNNAGKEDKKPHFKVNIVDNLSSFSAPTANTYYKAAFDSNSNGLSYACKYLLENNKYTYLTKNATDMVIWINGNISANNTNRVVNVALRKNGSVSTALSTISPISVRTSTSLQPNTFGMVAYLEDFVKGDYIEIFASSTGSNDTLRIQDLTIFAQGQ